MVTVLAQGFSRGTGNSAFSAGQTAGDLISVVQGAVETVVGATVATGGTVGGVVTSPTGVGAVAGATVATGGVVVAAHGVSTAKNGLNNLLKADGNSNNGRQNVTKTYSTRKRASDARPKPKPAQPGEKRVTRQTKNNSGEGNKMKTDGGKQTEHFHDNNHNDKSKTNVHYRTTKKIKPNE